MGNEMCNEAPGGTGPATAQPSDSQRVTADRTGERTRAPHSPAEAAPSDGPTLAAIAPDAGDAAASGRDTRGRFGPGNSVRRRPVPKADDMAARLAAGDLTDVQAALRREAAAILVKLARTADAGTPKYEALRRRLSDVLDDLGLRAPAPPRAPAAKRKDAIDPAAGLRAVEAALRDAGVTRDEN